MLETFFNTNAQIEHHPLHLTDVPATWADISKARRLLQWEPQTSLEEGLRQTVAWHREQQSWLNALAT